MPTTAGTGERRPAVTAKRNANHPSANRRGFFGWPFALLVAQIGMFGTAGLAIVAYAAAAPNCNYLSGHAKTQVTLRDRLFVSLRPRLAEFAAAD